MKLKALKCCYCGGRSFLLFGFALLIFNCTSVSAAELLAGIAENVRIVLFFRDDPEDVDVMQVEGLQPGEKILGLDTRPATGQLYALGSSSQIYVGSFNDNKVSFTAAGVPFTPTLMGSAFGFDFNPAKPLAFMLRIIIRTST